MNPKISVILSVYNGEKYLKEAVESILNQTFSDFEFIIVNDGSTDDTEKILDEFNDRRIVRLNNDKNMGLVKSLNKGLAAAQGKFIARMDADDISKPERFEKQIKFLEKNSKIGVLGTAMEQIDAKGKKISVLCPPLNHKLILWKMFFECPIFHPTVMMRRDILEKVGGYDISFIHTEDTDLWSRLYKLTRFANLSDVLHIRRLHNKSIISTQSDIQHKSGIIIKQRLFNEILGREVPSYIIEWFSQPEKSLSRNQIKEIISLLVELHTKMFQGEKIDIETKKILQEDLEKRIMIISQGDRRFLIKKAVSLLRRIIPVPLRHKIRMIIEKYL